MTTMRLTRRLTQSSSEDDDDELDFSKMGMHAEL